MKLLYDTLTINVSVYGASQVDNDLDISIIIL